MQIGPLANSFKKTDKKLLFARLPAPSIARVIENCFSGLTNHGAMVAGLDGLSNCFLIFFWGGRISSMG
jgi:hypothetical protein